MKRKKKIYCFVLFLTIFSSSIILFNMHKFACVSHAFLVCAHNIVLCFRILVNSCQFSSYCFVQQVNIIFNLTFLSFRYRKIQNAMNIFYCSLMHGCAKCHTGFFGVFTVPKVCSLYSAQITAYGKIPGKN